MSLNSTSCYTTFVEVRWLSHLITHLLTLRGSTLRLQPHYEFTGDNAPPYFTAVHNFVSGGGNFYGQCAGTVFNRHIFYVLSSIHGDLLSCFHNWKFGTLAIRSYESGGGFMTYYGAENQNENNQDLLFLYPDLPYSQVVGDIDGSNGGSVSDFYTVLPPGVNSVSNQARFLPPHFPAENVIGF